MNERFKDLMEQAGFDPVSIERMGVMPQAKKFTELIVQECIRIPYDMWDKAELNADIAAKIENKIRNHFWMFDDEDN